MSARLDPSNTLAFLVGGATYEDFPAIPAAAQNVEDFSNILKDEAIFGLSDGQIKKTLGADHIYVRRQLREHIRGAKSRGVKTLIFYFTGHGYLDVKRDYYLVAGKTKREEVEEDGATALRFETIKKIIAKEAIPQTIFIIDACYSGMLSQGNGSLAEQVSLKGSYTITSSAGHEESFFNTNERYTVFTGELIRILKRGLSDFDAEYLTLTQLYDALSRAVKKRNPGMSPLKKATEELQPHRFLLCKNCAFDQEARIYQSILDDIKDIQESEVEKGYIRRAERSLKGLRTETKEQLVDEEKKTTALQKIQERLEFCRRYPEYKRIIERRVRTDLEAKLTVAQKQLADRETELTACRETLKDTEGARVKDQKTIRTLQQREKTLEKQLPQTQAALRQTENALSAAKQKSQAINQENSRLKQELKAAQQRIAELNVELADGRGKISSTSRSKPSPIIRTFEMIQVSGGHFQMGNPDPQAPKEQRPLQSVQIKNFLLGKFLVTQELWELIMEDNPSKFKLHKHLPVDNISWAQAKRFIERLNEDHISKGYKFRLPSEAEWEYAARGGSKASESERKTPYAGNAPLSQVGWHASNANGTTHPPGKLAANELGFHDMSGNLWEWCEDKWATNYRELPLDGTAQRGKLKIQQRVLRGGSWFDDAAYCTIYDRNPAKASEQQPTFGLRLAATPQ